jgi:hypothetical protein
MDILLPVTASVAHHTAKKQIEPWPRSLAFNHECDAAGTIPCGKKYINASTVNEHGGEA